MSEEPKGAEGPKEGVTWEEVVTFFGGCHQVVTLFYGSPYTVLSLSTSFFYQYLTVQRRERREEEGYCRNEGVTTVTT